MEHQNEQPKRLSDVIIDEQISKLENHLTQSKNLIERMKESIEKIKNGERLKINTAQIVTMAEKVAAVKKDRVVVYLANHAKMTIEDPAILEIIGSFKQWREKKEGAARIQQLLLELAKKDDEIMSLLEERYALVKQQEVEDSAAKAEQPQPTTEEVK